MTNIEKLEKQIEEALRAPDFMHATIDIRKGDFKRLSPEVLAGTILQNIVYTVGNYQQFPVNV